MNQAILLGVNIDHVATLRQARQCAYPDPVFAAQLAEQAGADGITLHLREDRRHIQERDVLVLKEVLQTRMNFEMAVTPFMLDFAKEIKPRTCCLVPEKREEVTTEGGLDVAGHLDMVKKACQTLHNEGIEVSLFIDPAENQIDASLKAGAKIIELHTGAYADAKTPAEMKRQLKIIQEAAHYAHSKGLQVNAGHGLHYHNVADIAAIPELVELNIGHAIIAQAVFTGITEAVRSMKTIMQNARRMHFMRE